MSVITKSYNTNGSSVDLTGEVTDLHGESSLECYFQWGVDTSYGNTTPAQTISSLTTFSDTITGLDLGGTYHFRSVATDGTNYWYGDDVEFTTGFVLDEQFSQEQADLCFFSSFTDQDIKDVDTIQDDFNNGVLNNVFGTNNDTLELSKLIGFIGLEDGVFSSEWEKTDNLFIKSDRVYSGSYSAGQNSGNSIDALLAPKCLTGGEKPEVVEFYWQETTNQSGFTVQFIDSSGQVILEVGGNNPQWEINDADGSFSPYNGDGYGRWIQYKITFDWVNGTYSYHFEDLSSGTVREGSGRSLFYNTDLEKLAFNNSNGNWGSADHMWFDNIAIYGSEHSVSGSRITLLDLSSLGLYRDSRVEWTATVPVDTSLTIETRFSLDGGINWTNWQTSVNGSRLPGLSTGDDISNAVLECRQTLETTDTSTSPQLDSLGLYVVRDRSFSYFVNHFAYPQIDSQDGFHLQSSIVDPLIIGSLIKEYLTSEFFLDQKYLHGSAVVNFTEDIYRPPEAQTVKVDIAEDPGIEITANSMIGQFERPGLSSWTYYSDPYKYTLDVSTQIFGAYPFEATMDATLCRLDETFHSGYYSISMPIYRIPDGQFANVDFAGHLYHCYWFDTSFVQEQYEIITGPRLDTPFPDIVYDFRFRGYLYATFTDVDYTFYFHPRFDSAFQKYELFNTFGLHTDYIFPVPDHYLTMCMRLDLLKEFTRHTIFGVGASTLSSNMFTIFQHLELDVEGSMTYMRLIEDFLYPEKMEIDGGSTAMVLNTSFSYSSYINPYDGAMQLQGGQVNFRLDSSFAGAELSAKTVAVIRFDESFQTMTVSGISGLKLSAETVSTRLFALELIDFLEFSGINLSGLMKIGYKLDILNYNDREPASNTGSMSTSTDDKILSYDGEI